MSKQLNKFFLATVISILPFSSHALPVDWHGTFGVDSTMLNSYRRINSKTAVTHADNGSQEVALDNGNEANASWQSYVLKLSPTVVINDAATFNAQLTTGYASGGFLGDSLQTSKVANTNDVPLYYHNQASGSGLNIKKAYLELHSDTALYILGRHSFGWGLGGLYNEGNESFDRHSSSHDGVMMKLKIGNFNVTPYWSKNSNVGYTDATLVKEYGVGLLYDNAEKDIAFGLLYGLKSSGGSATILKSTVNTPTQDLGASDVKITDIYFKKIFGKIDLAVEVPLMSGNLGKTIASSSETSYSAKAILFQSNYRHSDSWIFGLDAGKVSGHDGSTSKFGALYLNPNYQIANLLFRYNLSAIGDSTHAQSVYDSYITNTMYVKLRTSYKSEKWTFDSGLIWAKADQVAQSGKAAYNHTKNKNFTTTTGLNQSDSLGTEIDMDAKYHWNNEVTVGAGLGYLLTGDYYGFTNSAANSNSVKSSMVIQMNTSVTF